MRKALFGMLMATVLAAPALAQEIQQEGEMPESYRRQAERNQADSDRQVAREAARAERQAERAQQRMESVEPRVERREDRIEQRSDAERVFHREQRQERREDVEARIARERAQRVYPDGMPENYRRQWDRNEAREARRQEEELRRSEARQGGRWDNRRDRRDWNNDRRWDNDGRWYDDGRNWGDNRYGWDRGWRQDRRYDWQRHRYSNRNIFRPGPYYSPYRNYGYNRFSIGVTLGRDFYSNRYWINDPWQYRLPQAYPGTRWVRYYNDVLLVDVFNGRVVDVIHDFFW